MGVILNCIIFIPLLAAVGLVFFPPHRVRWIKLTALLATTSVLALSVCLVCAFNPAYGGIQASFRIPWIPAINTWYFVGVDGLSLALVVLTALLGFLACLASGTIQHRQKEYYISYLVLMTGMLGTFLALDLFLFYIFWEAVLIPMYFLIGIWGGPRKEYAAIKFLLYTLAGSVFMLIGILVVYFTAVPHTFDMLQLAGMTSGFNMHLQMWLFWAFFIAFAVKVPVFPFHTWLPDAHVEAPTPISVILAGVLLKMGGYGIMRICFPFFPTVVMVVSPLLAALGVINVVYGACVAMGQIDFKKMVAYSSVSHMGFVLLGLASCGTVGLNGSLLVMINHGIITGAMFLLVGVLYERAHTRRLDQFGGLSGQLPVYAFFLTLATLASLGLPGLSGFVGEFMSLLGSFAEYPVIAVMACLGLVVTVGYSLYMIQRVLLGMANTSVTQYQDMNKIEIITVVPLAVLMFVFGVYPDLLLRFQEATITAMAYIF